MLARVFGMKTRCCCARLCNMLFKSVDLQWWDIALLNGNVERCCMVLFCSECVQAKSRGIISVCISLYWTETFVKSSRPAILCKEQQTNDIRRLKPLHDALVVTFASPLHYNVWQTYKHRLLRATRTQQCHTKCLICTQRLLANVAEFAHNTVTFCLRD